MFKLSRGTNLPSGLTVQYCDSKRLTFQEENRILRIAGEHNVMLEFYDSTRPNVVHSKIIGKPLDVAYVVSIIRNYN